MLRLSEIWNHSLVKALSRFKGNRLSRQDRADVPRQGTLKKDKREVPLRNREFRSPSAQKEGSVPANLRDKARALSLRDGNARITGRGTGPRREGDDPNPHQL